MYVQCKMWLRCRQGDGEIAASDPHHGAKPVGAPAAHRAVARGQGDRAAAILDRYMVPEEVCCVWGLWAGFGRGRDKTRQPLSATDASMHTVAPDLQPLLLLPYPRCNPVISADFVPSLTCLKK